MSHVKTLALAAAIAVVLLGFADIRSDLGRLRELEVQLATTRARLATCAAAAAAPETDEARRVHMERIVREARKDAEAFIRAHEAADRDERATPR